MFMLKKFSNFTVLTNAKEENYAKYTFHVNSYLTN